MKPKLLILNQMAGPMTWELAEDLGKELGVVALLTGHPDTLAKGSTESLLMTPAPAYKRGSFARRAFSWVAYCVKAFFWVWQFPKTTPMLVFSNPPILCWTARLIQFLRGQSYAVMIHDIYPDILVRLQGFSETHLLIRVWRFINRHAYQKARVVMTLGEYMAANLEKQFDPSKTAAGKIEIIYPWVDTERFHPIPKEENWFAQKYGQVGKLTVMYSGNMGLGHDIETMLEAAKLLKDEPNIHFMFIGAGPKWKLVEGAIKKFTLNNVTLLGWQDESVLPFSLACSDVTLVSIEAGLEGLAIPSKAIYALSTGSVLLLISKKINELSSWIITDKLGGISAINDFQNLSRTLLAIASNAESIKSLKENTRVISCLKFSRQKLSSKKFNSLLMQYL